VTINTCWKTREEENKKNFKLEKEIKRGKLGHGE
jgi:hypothetical protein